MDCVITDNGNCVSTGGETVLGVDVSGSLDNLGGDNFSVGGWFVDNSDRVIWRKEGGRLINVWDEYVDMLGSIREFLFGGEFLSNEKYRRVSDGVLDLRECVRRHIREVYGCSFVGTYNMVHKTKGDAVKSSDIYNALIDYYGVDGMKWSYLFRGLRNFTTSDERILNNIANDTLAESELYRYFVNRYGLFSDGIEVKVRPSDGGLHRLVRLKWDGGCRLVDLSELVYDKRQAWSNMTNGRNRDDIRDYDKFLAGRDESVVMPDRCPIFGNIILNYTGIDFQGKQNKKRCSLAVYEGSDEVEWSAASIDRIDSSKGYTYDNIRVISDFANSLKNCYSEYHFERMLEYMRSNPK